MRSFVSSCLVGLLVSCTTPVVFGEGSESSSSSNLRGAVQSLDSAPERRATELEYTVSPGGASSIPMCPSTNQCCKSVDEEIDVQTYTYGQGVLDGTTMDLTLKIYRFKSTVGQTPPMNLPVILHIPGGNFEPYVKDEQHDGRARALAKRGFAVAMVDYRKHDLPADLTPENFVPKIQPNYYNYLMVPVEDILTAVKWLVKEGGALHLDTSNMAAFGCSGGAMYASSASILNVTREFPELADAADHISSTLAVGASVPWAIVRTFGLQLRDGEDIPPYTLVHSKDPWFYPYAMAQGAQVFLGAQGAEMTLITRELTEEQRDFVCDELESTAGVHGAGQSLFDDLMATQLSAMNVQGCAL